MYCLWLSLLVVAREFKPVRFFVMMALATFVVCGVTAFYTHRAAHGRTAEERSAYATGVESGRTSAAARNFADRCRVEYDRSKKISQQQGSGDRQRWDLAFESGYTDGFRKTHGR